MLARARRRAAQPAAAVDQWRPFYFLTASVLCRSLVFFAFNTFLPLYWIHVFGSSREMGSSALSVFLFSGAAGTLVGGKLGDRFPRHRVVSTCLAASLPFMAALLFATKSSLAMVILAPLGFTLFAPYSVMVVLGQEYLPNRVGTASGVTIGLAGTIGGLGAPAFGALADHYGLHAALTAPILLGCVATALTFFLKAAGFTDDGAARAGRSRDIGTAPLPWRLGYKLAYARYGSQPSIFNTWRKPGLSRDTAGK